MKTMSKHALEWSEEDITILREKHQDSFDEFQEWLNKGEMEGKTCFVKEHAIFLTYSVSQSKYLFGYKDNSAIKKGASVPVRIYLRILQLFLWLYEHILTSKSESHVHHNCRFKSRTQKADPYPRSTKPFSPTPSSLPFAPFLVRDPALVFPCYYRAHTDSYGKPKNQVEEHDLIYELTPWMTFHWMRWLYQFYCQQLGFQVQIHPCKLPIILDADDIISSSSTITHYAMLIGLDPTKLPWDWEPAS
jgi:hypothetical protein